MRPRNESLGVPFQGLPLIGGPSNGVTYGRTTQASLAMLELRSSSDPQCVMAHGRMLCTCVYQMNSLIICIFTHYRDTVRSRYLHLNASEIGQNDRLGSQQPRYFEYMRDVSGQPEVQSSGSARRRHRRRSAIDHVISSQVVD